MRREIGNMWDAFDSADLFLICTNGSLHRDGRLVMGAGIAKEALGKFPGLDVTLGKALAPYSRIANGAVHYGLLPGKKLGCFQTQYQWSDKAYLDLIALSMAELVLWHTYHPTAQVHLNYPGIGLGGLSIAEVEPYVSQLPDQVTLWRRP